MIKIAAVVFVMAVASSAQTLPLAPLQSETLIVTVRQGCGTGFTRVNGRCVRTPARAAARRCATGLRLVDGRCIR
jgi:hypothetical protein